MTRLLASLLLLLAVAPAQAQPPQPLAVVFVEVEGAEPWTAAREGAALADAQAALDWLRARGLDAPAGVERLPAWRVARAELRGWRWLADSPDRIVLFVVNNAGLPHVRLGPDGWSGAFVPPSRVLILAETGTPRPALIAHELAHLLTGLPDWPDAACYAEPIDILCRGPHVTAAYRLNTLGCITSAALGDPCRRTYLPEVWR